MARIIIFLLCLLLRSNVYAEAYGANCIRIDGVWHCPYEEVPYCIEQTEYRTLSCPINQSGAINQSRYYSCSTQTWSDWITTSNNCTQDPPTCIESSETRQLTCQAGYEGVLQEQRTSICSNPYGSPTWTAWSEIYNTCNMTVTNLNNLISPISPISPMNPNSLLNQLTTAPLIQIEPVIAPELTALTTTEAPTTSVKNTTTSDTDKQDNVKGIDVPKDKELVPGFGLVMSLQLINQAYNMQQAQMQDTIKLEQENEYGRIQDITFSLYTETTIGDRFDSINRSRWTSLLRNYPLQRLKLYDRGSQEDE